MKTVNVHEAKTQLSRLIAEADAGEPFIIARAGKPIVKVTALGILEAEAGRRLGFLEGSILVPEDFDRMGEALIEGLFVAER